MKPLYLLFLWTVPGLHLHLQRDGLPDALSLGQTVLIWKQRSQFLQFLLNRKLTNYTTYTAA